MTKPGVALCLAPDLFDPERFGLLNMVIADPVGFVIRFSRALYRMGIFSNLSSSPSRSSTGAGLNGAHHPEGELPIEEKKGEKRRKTWGWQTPPRGFHTTACNDHPPVDSKRFPHS